MVGAVVQRDLDVDHRITGEHAREHRALDTGIDRRDILLGNAAADRGVDELVALAGLIGLNVDLDMTVLALTAALAGILGVLIDGLGDGLLIGDLRRADVRLDLELAEQGRR